MPTFEIEAHGKKFEVDAPDQTTALSAIGSPKGMDFLKGTFSNILPAIGSSLAESGGIISKGLLEPKGGQGVLEGTLGTGKGLFELGAAIPKAISAGAGAFGGPLMGATEHAIGSVIAPQTAKKDIPEEMAAKGSQDVQTALMGLGPARTGPGIAGITRRLPEVAPPKSVSPTEHELRAAYKADYDISEKSGVVFKPEAVKRFKDKMILDLEGSGNDPILSDKTYKILDKLDNRTTVPQIDAVRKLLGQLAGSPDKFERRAASEAIGKIDTFLKDVPNLEQARANYAARERSLLINKAIERAKRQASRGGSGFNIDNALRQELSKIREKKSRGFTEQELATMDKIIEGSYTGDLLRWVGNLAAPTDFMHAGVGGGLGYAIGGPAGAVALPAAGMASKKIADAMTLGKIKKLAAQTRSRSPLAEKENAVRQYLRDQGLQ